MPSGLRVAAVIAVVIGAAAYFSSRTERKIAASGSDTTEIRARLIAYLGAVERTLPLLDAVALEAGLDEATVATTRSLAVQCAAACERLAFEPPADQASLWSDIERTLEQNREWWNLPVQLQNALERMLAESSEGPSRLADSPHDDCPAGVSPVVLGLIKGAEITAGAVADAVPTKAVPVKVVAVIVRSVAEIAFEIASSIDGGRTGCVQEKVFDVLDKLEVMHAKLEEIVSAQGSMERLQIEDDLARSGSTRIGTFELLGRPENCVIDGRLMEVREIVRETLLDFARRGQLNRRSDARENWLRAEHWRLQGLYIEAYTQYRAAYQAGVGE